MLNKIICIDDDETTLILIKMIIEKSLFAKEVITINSGTAALDFYHNLATNPVASTPPQLIFLDLNMPVMNGWEFLNEFIETLYPKFNNTKVVILSSSDDPSDKEKAKEYPIIIGYVSKPITTDLLRKLLY